MNNPYRILHPDSSLWVPGRKPTGPIELDRTNPLTRDMTLAVPFSEGAGLPRDYARGIPIKAYASAPDPVRAVIAGERCVSFNTGNEESAYQIDDQSWWQTTAGEGQTLIILVNAASVTSFDYIFRNSDVSLYTGGGASVTALFFRLSGVALTSCGTPTDSSTVWDGRIHSCGYSFQDDAGGDSHVTYLNGLQANTNTTNVSATSPGTTYIGRNPSNGFGYSGNVHGVYYWKRKLTPTEVYEFSQNPYRIFKPKTNYYFPPVVAAGTDIFITGIKDPLIISEKTATVVSDIDVDIQAVKDALSISEKTATVEANIDTDITGTKDSLGITEYVSTVVSDVDVSISANLDSVVLTEYLANVALDHDINISGILDNLVISEKTATVVSDIDTDITATKDVLSLTEYVASVILTNDVNIFATKDSVLINEYASVVQADIDTDISSALKNVLITEYPSTVDVSVDVNISAILSQRIISEKSATVVSDIDTDISSVRDPVVLTEYNAVVQSDVDVLLNASLKNLSITEYIASVELGADVNISATLSNKVLSEYPASIVSNIDTDIISSKDPLVITEYPASLVVDVDVSISASFKNLTITGRSSSVVIGEKQAEMDDVGFTGRFTQPVFLTSVTFNNKDINFSR